ncbi:MAG: inorganic phosphate transporter, partial [Verrucomicrobia bacterium]|nr:inorganic phosphate transporter [Verrucomicrobiota bacterium]
MNLFGDTLTFSNGTFLILALALALLFECVNGFHDTANAVATVIYTHSLRPWIAVIWSGIWNLIGVLTSSGAVAFSIVALLPVELVLNVGSAAGFSMVFSLLISAIIWNLGTWYLGLPTSSSHTLIGSIMGVGLANSLMTPGHVFGEGVNWGKTQEVFSSLLLSPVVGFVCSALLLLLARAFFIRQKNGKELFVPADKKKTPPWWIRSLLVLTCTGVSFAHGSNDGQKGMGLIVLILVGMLPGTFALNLGADTNSFQQLIQNAKDAGQILDRKSGGKSMPVQDGRDHLSDFLKTNGRSDERTWPAIATVNHELIQGMQGKSTFKDFSKDDRSKLRSDIYLIG